jgi:hypothetical protein
MYFHRFSRTTRIGLPPIGLGYQIHQCKDHLQFWILSLPFSIAVYRAAGYGAVSHFTQGVLKVFLRACICAVLGRILIFWQVDNTFLQD